MKPELTEKLLDLIEKLDRNIEMYAFTIEMMQDAIEKGKNEGYVYIIVRKRDALVKIGRSSNPDDRIKSFKTAIPDLEVHEIIPTSDMQTLEKGLHEGLRDYRIEGTEWFDLRGNFDFIEYAITPFDNIIYSKPVKELRQWYEENAIREFREIEKLTLEIKHHLYGRKFEQGEEKVGD